MSEFIVSARKYRPTTFDSVVGQPVITRTLKNAISSDHMAQAFLFCGPRGVGKTTCARILAKTINCQKLDKKNVEPCNECDSCTSFNEGSSLNIFELDGASNNSVDDIRHLIDQVRFAPQLGDYKVFIIDEVHMLSQAAFNAFLKTLEEPPSHAIFILATTEKHKILPTILSRCQIFDFNRISVKDIADHLATIAKKEKVSIDAEALHIIADKAEGGLRDALSIFDQMVTFCGLEVSAENVRESLNVLDHEYYFKISDLLYACNYQESLVMIDQILSKGFDADSFVYGLAGHLRNVLMSRDPRTISLLEVTPETGKKYNAQAQACEEIWLLNSLSALTELETQFRFSRNKRLSLEIGLMELCNREVLEKKKRRRKLSPALPFSGSIRPQTAKPQQKPTPPPTEQKTPPPRSNDTTKINADAGPGQKPVPKKSQGVKGLGALKQLSTFSIKNGPVSEKATKPGETVESEDTTLLADRPRESFTPDQLWVVWSSYAEILKSKGNESLAATLIKRKPEMAPDLQLKFTLDTKVQEEDMQVKKADFIQYLRQELKNFDIQLNFDVAAIEDNSSKIYTGRDKYEHMAGKNPKLHELRKRLNLDIEY